MLPIGESSYQYALKLLLCVSISSTSGMPRATFSQISLWRSYPKYDINLFIKQDYKIEISGGIASYFFQLLFPTWRYLFHCSSSTANKNDTELNRNKTSHSIQSTENCWECGPHIDRDNYPSKNKNNDEVYKRRFNLNLVPKLSVTGSKLCFRCFLQHLVSQHNVSRHFTSWLIICKLKKKYLSRFLNKFVQNTIPSMLKIWRHIQPNTDSVKNRLHHDFNRARDPYPREREREEECRWSSKV